MFSAKISEISQNSLLFSARTRGCKSRLHKPVGNDDERHFKVVNGHSPEPDARKLGKKQVMTKLKRLAKTTDTNVSNIINQSLRGVQDATKAAIPKRSQLKRTINRVRHDPAVPKNPTTLKDLHFEADDFLLFDSAHEDEDSVDRIVMFGPKKNLSFLEQCSELYMDGTLKITPPLFKQVYSIHSALSFMTLSFDLCK